MTIEVRQLVIKSQVHDRAVPVDGRERPVVAPEAVKRLKAELLKECRQAMREMLSQSNER